MNSDRDQEEAYSPIILVIEDDPLMQEVLRDLLQPEFQLVITSDGEEGIHTATEIIPDLVISDITMPVRNGYEVCSALKKDERTSHIPVILLTARIESESRIGGFESGADAYVTKPFLPRELMARIRNLISLREHLRERFKAGVVLKVGEVAVASLDDEFLGRVQRVLEAHLSEENPSLEGLSREIGLSRSQLHRKLVALTGMSAREYLQYLRLHRAMKLLEANAGTVSEIAYQVGFNSVQYFSKCFRNRFGKPPSKVRNGHQ
jgi:DNA-binding response OmpR family regulator